MGRWKTTMATLTCDCGFSVKEDNRYEVEAKMWHHAIHDHGDMLKSMSVDQLTQWLTGADKQLGNSSVIHQEVMFEASPNRIYEALTDAAQFSKVSGGAEAEMTPEAGGSFSCFGGMILGKIYGAGAKQANRSSMACRELGRRRIFTGEVRTAGGRLRNSPNLQPYRLS